MCGTLIKSQKPWSLFVTDRLKEIRSVEGLKFKHVSSEDNPADLATRGKYPKDLESSIWMRYPENQWPTLKIPDCKTAEFESELEGSNTMFEASLLSREHLSREVSQLLIFQMLMKAVADHC